MTSINHNMFTYTFHNCFHEKVRVQCSRSLLSKLELFLSSRAYLTAKYIINEKPWFCIATISPDATIRLEIVDWYVIFLGSMWKTMRNQGGLDGKSMWHRCETNETSMRKSMRHQCEIEARSILNHDVPKKHPQSPYQPQAGLIGILLAHYWYKTIILLAHA
jgi:hypothetical protein